MIEKLTENKKINILKANISPHPQPSIKMVNQKKNCMCLDVFKSRNAAFQRSMALLVRKNLLDSVLGEI